MIELTTILTIIALMIAPKSFRKLREASKIKRFTTYAVKQKKIAIAKVQADKRLTYKEKLYRVNRLEAQADRISRIASNGEPFKRRMNQIENILEKS